MVCRKYFKKNFKENNKSPQFLNYNNHLIKGPNDMANTFNTSFLNKINNLNNNIPIGMDPMLFYKQVIKSPTEEFKFKKTGLAKMARVIEKIKSTNTTGMDCLS